MIGKEFETTIHYHPVVMAGMEHRPVKVLSSYRKPRSGCPVSTSAWRQEAKAEQVFGNTGFRISALHFPE